MLMFLFPVHLRRTGLPSMNVWATWLCPEVQGTNEVSVGTTYAVSNVYRMLMENVLLFTVEFSICAMLYTQQTSAMEY